MEIKYWSDVACPFCYIGSTRLKRALKNMGLADKTTLELKSFQLNPREPKVTDKPYINHFTGGRKELEPQARSQMKQIEAMGKTEGLQLNLDKIVPTNTMDAHRLIKLAASKGNAKLTEDLIRRFYHIYFTEGKSIADHKVLIQAAVAAGLDEKEVKDVLDSDRYRQDVINDEIEAQKAGVQGAPFFVFDNKYGLSGAQPYSVFVKAIKQVFAAEAK